MKLLSQAVAPVALLLLPQQQARAFSLSSSKRDRHQHFYWNGPETTSWNDEAQHHAPDRTTNTVKTSSRDFRHQPDRREWLADAAKILVGGGGVLSLPSSSNAATLMAAPEATKIEFPPSLCDPSVSTWRNPANGRVVHILGTAHISQSSAELAGMLVKDVRPNAVFVELDRKRISRAMPKGGDDGSTRASTGASGGGAAPSESAQSAEMAAKMADGPAVASGGADGGDAGAGAMKGNPFAVKERVLNAGAKMVGDAIKSMYSKLDDEGFKAGEEFVVAIREGLAINAAVVLGDQDVEVTLRRLTGALSKTDLKKLFASDSDLEKAMDSLMPNGGKSATVAAMSGGGGSKEGLENTAGEKISKEQFKQFVETVKARDNVRLVMTKLRETAPELFKAMVAERDAYMANGINKLDQFDKMVAVVGIAHVDGIEANLKERGWAPVSIPCQLR